MHSLSIHGPPCPICGHSLFNCHADDEMLIEIGDARYLPRVCSECGNIQLVLTRTDELVEELAC